MQKYSLDWIHIQKMNRTIKMGELLAAFQSKDIPPEDDCIRMDDKRNAIEEIIYFLLNVGRERVEDTFNAIRDGIELDGVIYSVWRSPANKGEIISGNHLQM